MKPVAKKKLTPNEVSLGIEYTDRLLSPELWLRKADELLAAAKELEPKVRELWDSYRVRPAASDRAAPPTNLLGVYFMLVAYGVENLCKTELVRRVEDKYRHQVIVRLPEFLKSHDLTTLLTKIDFAFDVAEEELLARLSMNSIWAGRYPIPVDSDGIRGAKQLSDGKTYLMAFFGEADVLRLGALTHRIRSYVERCIVGETSPHQEGAP